MRQTFLKKMTLQSSVLAASTDYAVAGNQLPTKTADGRYIYNRGFLVEMDATIAFTANPGAVGHNAIIKRAQWGTGNQLRYALSGNALRAFEVMEGGKRSQLEAIQTATTHPRFISFYIPNGPAKFFNPDDFDIANANLQDAEFKITTGALLDLSSDATALSGTIRVWAVQTVKDTLDGGVFYERREEAVASGVPLQGRCLLACIGLAHPTYAGVQNGEFGQLTVETGNWNIVDGVDASTIARLHNYQWTPGELDSMTGEPRDNTYDINQREVNLASPTALAANVARFQPVLLLSPAQKMTQLLGQVPANFNVKWTGTADSTTLRLVGRFLPVDDSKVGEQARTAARILGATPVLHTAKVKTATGGKAGPAAAFMRRSVKVVGKTG